MVDAVVKAEEEQDKALEEAGKAVAQVLAAEDKALEVVAPAQVVDDKVLAVVARAPEAEASPRAAS